MNSKSQIDSVASMFLISLLDYGLNDLNMDLNKRPFYRLIILIRLCQFNIIQMVQSVSDCLGLYVTNITFGLTRMLC